MNQVIWTRLEVWDDSADGKFRSKFAVWHDEQKIAVLKRVGALTGEDWTASLAASSSRRRPEASKRRNPACFRITGFLTTTLWWS